MPKLPNLIIAGVNKAGTTSIFSYLVQHPDVSGSKVKETCFFLPIRYGQSLPDIANYTRFFNDSNGKFTIEATPGYFYGGEALARAIKHHLGDVKIVIVLREPVSRLLSFFKFQKSMLKLDEDLSLPEYIERCQALSGTDLRQQENNAFFGLEGGFYADYLPGWIDTFGTNLKIIFFEELKHDRYAFMTNLSSWMGIDSSFFNSTELHIENKSAGYKSRFLQWIALTVNRYGEYFWRKFPNLKRFLKDTYAALNRQSQHVVHNSELIGQLEQLYLPYNRRLKAQLEEFGLSRYPGWLQET